MNPERKGSVLLLYVHLQAFDGLCMRNSIQFDADRQLYRPADLFSIIVTDADTAQPL